MRQLSSGRPTRRFFYITLITDNGNALEYAPELGRELVIRDFRKIAHVIGPDAVGFLELQAVTNFPYQNFGGTMMLHANLLAWTDDPAFDFIDA